jgi:3-deoxy-D-manno-octulosonate 8-phosphate phosphatase (KDO 8-P phosphatase)
MPSIKEKFIQSGGIFFDSEENIAEKLSKISVFIFDWDGVFNDGAKGSERGSGFSESDAMGLNMLRFNHWRIHHKLPYIFIISGENNTNAIELAKREHFNAVYLRFLNKRKAMEKIAGTYKVSYDEMAFIFDDILDVDAAAMSQLAFCARRNASPLFQDYLIENHICHYMSGHEGGHFAVREISELIIGLTGEYSKTISKRIEFGDEYQQYLAQRNKVDTTIETTPI